MNPEENLTPDEGTEAVIPPTEENKEGEGESVTPETTIEEELDENGQPIEKKPEEIVEEKKEEIPPHKPAEEPDYKKKFGESTRQNQIVASQFNELKKTLGDITKQEIPTDDEMARIVPDWEYLSDSEKNREKKFIVLERRQNHMLKTMHNIASETENASKLDKFIATVPQLKGKENEFYEFATKPKNKGATMEVLLNAFLYDVKETKPVDTPKPPTEETPPSLERSTPSGGEKPSSGKKEYSDEELATLRTKDPKKYHELIRKGQI